VARVPVNYLLDTHTWVWWHMRPDRLSKTARQTIASASRAERLLLSVISVWEFCKLVQKGRLGIVGDPEAWVELALSMSGLRLAPLTPGLCFKSTTLPPPFHNDPADQIIAATAREENAVVLTADKQLLAYPHIRSTG